MLPLELSLLNRQWDPFCAVLPKGSAPFHLILFPLQPGNILLQSWEASQLGHGLSLPQVLWDQNDVLQRELEELRLQLQENRAERGLLAGGKMQGCLGHLCLARARFCDDGSSGSVELAAPGFGTGQPCNGRKE